MTETIRTIKLTPLDLSAIAARDVVIDRDVRGVDIKQIDGSYAIVEPYNSDGSYYGRIMLYPQSTQPSIYSPTELRVFDRVGSLYYPQDAKFDYVRGCIWIADTGNNRVLKVDLNTKNVRITIGSVIYPYALAVDLNTGNVFVKGYSDYTMAHGSIGHYRKDGTFIDSFIFNTTVSGSSSSSSSNSSESGSLSLSSSSSSSLVVFPSFPSVKSIVFDNSRSRLWWIDENMHVYMADVRGKYINSYDLSSDYFLELKNLDIELATGNVFITAKDSHSDWTIVQVNRDCNKYLSKAWITK